MAQKPRAEIAAKARMKLEVGAKLRSTTNNSQLSTATIPARARRSLVLRFMHLSLVFESSLRARLLKLSATAGFPAVIRMTGLCGSEWLR